jgi:hypothetical protein
MRSGLSSAADSDAYRAAQSIPRCTIVRASGTSKSAGT